MFAGDHCVGVADVVDYRFGGFRDPQDQIVWRLAQVLTAPCVRPSQSQCFTDDEEDVLVKLRSCFGSSQSQAEGYSGRHRGSIKSLSIFQVKVVSGAKIVPVERLKSGRFMQFDRLFGRHPILMQVKVVLDNTAEIVITVQSVVDADRDPAILFMLQKQPAFMETPRYAPVDSNAEHTDPDTGPMLKVQSNTSALPGFIAALK